MASVVNDPVQVPPHSNYIDVVASGNWTSIPDLSGDLSDMELSCEVGNLRGVLRGPIKVPESPDPIPSLLAVYRGETPVAHLLGGFADDLFAKLQTETPTPADQRHFPHVQPTSNFFKRAYMCAKHGTTLREAMLLEQLLEAAHHAPRGRGPNNWVMSDEFPKDKASPYIRIEKWNINFNGLAIELSASERPYSNEPLVQEQPQILFNNSSPQSPVEFTGSLLNEDGQTLLSLDRDTAARVIFILRDRKRHATNQ